MNVRRKLRGPAARIALILVGIGVVTGARAQALPRAMMEADIRSSGGRQIGGSELMQRLVGNTTYSVFLRGINATKAGDVVVVYYRDPKTRIVRWPNRFTYQSNVWLEGDALCVEQRAGTGAGHQCYSTWNLGNVDYNCALPKGDCLISFRVVPGNPEGM